MAKKKCVFKKGAAGFSTYSLTFFEMIRWFFSQNLQRAQQVLSFHVRKNLPAPPCPAWNWRTTGNIIYILPPAIPLKQRLLGSRPTVMCLVVSLLTGTLTVTRDVPPCVLLHHTITASPNVSHSPRNLNSREECHLYNVPQRSPTVI